MKAPSAVMMLALLVSGCAQTTSGPAAAGLADEESTGTIQGLVVSDEVFPVGGANVSVEDGPSTTTEADGSFRLTGLVAGDHRLSVAAPGYEPFAQAVFIAEGRVVELLITIEGLPGQSPYVSTFLYDGYTACAVSAVYTAGPTGGPCPFGEPAIGTNYGVDGNWVAGVHEIAWEGNEEMIFASSLADSCLTSGVDADPCPYLGWGRSPIRVFAEPNNAEYAKKYAIDGKAVWPSEAHTSFVFASYSGYLRTEVNQTAYPACVIINNQFGVPEHWGCPFGIGYATGLRFTIFHSTFYNQAPLRLQAFTAIPDQ